VTWVFAPKVFAPGLLASAVPAPAAADGSSRPEELS
jgi:hypothetical protein